ncbi:type III secretion protein HrpV [Ralstonia pickettii]|uniref:Type III secretion protein HrpV n=1 Tax=Ralstonia pickettii TaxID=329 RepID=A0A2N4TSI9_RALPI|nr:type III secretion protein HrpV [Ralstonia pickettii]PLC42663.1 type III secretion protein HrpV [Ralstonia pickettii]
MTRISASSPGLYALPDATQTQPTGAVTPNHRKRHRHGVHGHDHELAEQQLEAQSHHHKHLAQVAKRVRRPRTGKRSGAGSPEEPITDSAFEELLLMLEEHAKKVEPLIIGVGQQRSHNDGEDDQARDQRSMQGRRALLMRYLQETAAEPSSVHGSKPVHTDAATEPAAAGQLDMHSSAYLRLEQELLAVRHAMQAGVPMPLRMAFDIVRQYLKAAPLEGTPATLLAVKARLLAIAALQCTATRPLTDSEKTFNKLLPLLLLSASRPRTGRERGESVARGSAVAQRWTADIWSYRAGLGLALPPLPDSTL